MYLVAGKSDLKTIENYWNFQVF